MKQFNLQEYLANPSRQVVTREGKKVRIVCTDRAGLAAKPIVALITLSNCDEIVKCFWEDGIDTAGSEDKNDLFFAPEKHEGWINIFRGKDNPFTGNIIFTSKEEAEESGRHCCGFTKDLYMTSAKIEWEE